MWFKLKILSSACKKNPIYPSQTTRQRGVEPPYNDVGDAQEGILAAQQARRREDDALCALELFHLDSSLSSTFEK